MSKAEYMFMLVRLWVWVGHVLGLLATVLTCASTTNKATKQIPLSLSKTLLGGSTISGSHCHGNGLFSYFRWGIGN